MKKIIITTVFLYTLGMSSAAMAGLQNYYVKVEQASKCGKNPVKWQSSTEFVNWGTSTDKRSAVIGLPRENIDGVRVKVKCSSCSLYNNTKKNWWWWSAPQNKWRNDTDLGGYYSGSGTRYYRGEERNNNPNMCNADYSFGEKIMGLYWGYSSPGSQNTWIWYFESNPLP
ncbi:MAG: hypothetical protein GY847_29710 [Proteobacteria bacterium]|nr:hypothetical protein [Pseudomonadota bacterium]